MKGCESDGLRCPWIAALIRVCNVYSDNRYNQTHLHLTIKYWKWAGVSINTVPILCNVSLIKVLLDSVPVSSAKQLSVRFVKLHDPAVMCIPFVIVAASSTEG